MRNKSLPAVTGVTLIVLYTLWFFHDFPTHNKEAIEHLLASADSVEISFNTASGSNAIVRVNEEDELSHFTEIFQKSPLVAIPDTKAAVLGHAIFSARGHDVLCVDFCSFPLVLFNGRSYAVTPEFTIFARSLVERGVKGE